MQGRADARQCNAQKHAERPRAEIERGFFEGAIEQRELCAHERDYPLRIMNVLEIVGESMGLHRDDDFKRLKLMQDVAAIANDSQDLIAQHGLDMTSTRAAIQAMLDEQPLPLRSRGGSTSSSGPSSPTPLAPPR